MGMKISGVGLPCFFAQIHAYPFLALTIVAVNPVYQRRGIGSMLMRWACEEADKAHRDGILLASPAGIQLYAKFGFEKVGEVRTAKGTLHSMFRKAQNEG
jgi:predicted N-acetyltransferase YhbS